MSNIIIQNNCESCGYRSNNRELKDERKTLTERCDSLVQRNIALRDVIDTLELTIMRLEDNLEKYKKRYGDVQEEETVFVSNDEARKILLD